MKKDFICHSIKEYSNEKKIQLDLFDHTGAIGFGTIKLQSDKTVNEFKVGEHYEVSIKHINHDRH